MLVSNEVAPVKVALVPCVVLLAPWREMVAPLTVSVPVAIGPNVTEVKETVRAAE